MSLGLARGRAWGLARSRPSGQREMGARSLAEGRELARAHTSGAPPRSPRGRRRCCCCCSTCSRAHHFLAAEANRWPRKTIACAHSPARLPALRRARAHTHTHRHTHARTLTGQPWAPLTWPRGADLPPDSQDPNCSLSLRLLAQCQLAPSAGAQSWHLSLGLSARSQRYSHWRALNFARSQVAPTRACWLAGPLLPLGRRSLVLLFRRPPLMLDGSNTLACVCARRPKRTVCRWRLSQLNGARELSRRASE